MSLIDLFLKGGLVMWPILACSLVAVAIIAEKFWKLSRVKVDGSKFILRIRSVLSRGDVSAALSMCSEMDVPLSNILRSGLLKINESHEDIKDAVEQAARGEVYKLEKGLGILATIAGVAPLLGFLGTVTGMIAAFRVIEVNQGTVNPTLLAGGIWEALLTTAFGLFVGIPAYFMYNYFVTRVARFVYETESSSNDFLDVTQSERTRAVQNVQQPPQKNVGR